MLWALESIPEPKSSKTMVQVSRGGKGDSKGQYAKPLEVTNESHKKTMYTRDYFFSPGGVEGGTGRSSKSTCSTPRIN